MRTKYESEQFNGVCCFLLNPEWNRKIKWKRNAAPKYNENNDFDKEIGTCDDNRKVKIQQLTSAGPSVQSIELIQLKCKTEAKTM